MVLLSMQVVWPYLTKLWRPYLTKLWRPYLTKLWRRYLTKLWRPYLTKLWRPFLWVIVLAIFYAIVTTILRLLYKATMKGHLFMWILLNMYSKVHFYYIFVCLLASVQLTLRLPLLPSCTKLQIHKNHHTLHCSTI